MSLGSIVSMSLAYFISRSLRRFLISDSMTVLKENMSLLEILLPLSTCLIFIMLWKIFVSIDNISNRLYPGIFKIYAKGFWFSVTTFFSNLYISVRSSFPMKFFFVRNGMINFQKFYWLLNLSP